MHYLSDLNELLGCIGTTIYTLQKRMRSLEVAISYLNEDPYSSDRARADDLHAEKWALTVMLLQMGWKGSMTSMGWENPSFWA